MIALARQITPLIAAAMVTVVAVQSRADAAAETRELTVQLGAPSSAGRIADDFLGFGYETSAAAQDGYLSAKNARLVQFYRTLGTQGLVRIGGNVSDHTRYVADGALDPRPQNQVTTINKACLVSLGEFLRATGWRAMWGLNLGTGSKAEAVEEAVAVSSALGDRLESFEIGNEVNLQGRFKDNYAAFHAVWLDYKAAIRAALPTAVFSGPDSSGSVEWCENFARDEGGETRDLTDHYYRLGAKNPRATMEMLLLPDQNLGANLDKLQNACRGKRLRFRLNEVNSYSGGGKEGVSETFGSALWALDYLFLTAAHGCAGVNLQTDLNHLGWISHYSPLVHEGGVDNVSAHPEYYGMLAFAQAAKGELLEVQLSSGRANLTAYATSDSPQHCWVVLINKDLTADAEVKLSISKASAVKGRLLRLEAPSIESKGGVTLAGAQAVSDGTWSAKTTEPIAGANGQVIFLAPHASAVLLDCTL